MTAICSQRHQPSQRSCYYFHKDDGVCSPLFAVLVCWSPKIRRLLQDFSLVSEHDTWHINTPKYGTMTLVQSAFVLNLFHPWLHILFACTSHTTTSASERQSHSHTHTLPPAQPKDSHTHTLPPAHPKDSHTHTLPPAQPKSKKSLASTRARSVSDQLFGVRVEPGRQGWRRGLSGLALNAKYEVFILLLPRLASCDMKRFDKT